MNGKIYTPSDDSYFLSEILIKQIPKIKNYQSLKYLEIGSGSGIQLETLKNLGIKKSNIFSCEINQEAVKYCKKIGFNCIKSDLFSKIPKKNKFNLIIFNPPYLPADKYDKEKDTTGGKKGNEIINKFLTQTKKHLEKNGRILLLTSSFTSEINFKGYNKKVLAEKHLFFEKLYIWELKK